MYILKRILKQRIFYMYGTETVSKLQWKPVLTFDIHP